MFAGALVLVPFLVLLLGGAAVAVGLALTRRPDATLSDEIAAARRHGVMTSVLALASMLLGPLLLWPPLSQVVTTSILLGLLPLLGSCGAMLVLLAGELTWPRPRGALRTALVAPRSPGMFVRGPWATVAASATALLAVVVVAGGWLGRHDNGHSLHTVDIAPGGAMTERMAGPFPGWDYGLPQAVGLLTLGALLLLVLRATTDRPAVVTADGATDLLLRRASAARAYRVATFGVLVTTAGDLFFAGTAMQRIYTDSGDVAGIAAVMAALVAGLAALVVVLVPAPRLGTPAVEPSIPVSL